MKNHLIAPFVAVEAFGWVFGWHLIERTLSRYLQEVAELDNKFIDFTCKH